MENNAKEYEFHFLYVVEQSTKNAIEAEAYLNISLYCLIQRECQFMLKVQKMH